MNAELIEYYTNLLIMQYRDKPKARATIAAAVKAVEAGYNLETAKGKQLDVLAKYVNLQRVVTGVDFTRNYFSLVNYEHPGPLTGIAGLIRYDEVRPPDALILKYTTDQQSLYSLTDEELRFLIKLRIAQNNSNHSVGEIDEILVNFFYDQVIYNDNYDMTTQYIFQDDVTRVVDVAISEKILPKPAAVSVYVSFVPDVKNIFSLLKYDSTSKPDYTQGFNTYERKFFSLVRYETIPPYPGVAGLIRYDEATPPDAQILDYNKTPRSGEPFGSFLRY